MIFTILSGIACFFLFDSETCNISTAKIKMRTRTISLDYLDEINQYKKILKIRVRRKAN